MGGAPKGPGLRSPLPTPHVHAAPRRISERRAETRLPPGTARELNGAFSDHTTQEGGRNPSPATQSALNPGGTMHCSHSSGNKINISSPKDPHNGAFSWQGLGDQPAASTWQRGWLLGPCRLCPTCPGAQESTWPGLAPPAHFLVMAEHGQWPCGWGLGTACECLGGEEGGKGGTGH